MGGKVVSTSSSDSWLINRDNSSVGVSNKASIRSIASSIGDWSSSGINSTINSLRGKMVSTGSSNSWLIKRNNSSVRVSNELSVQVKGTSIAVGSSISRGISSIANSSNGSSSYSGDGSSISNSLGSKMVSTSSSNSWLINRGHCTIGMGLKTKERSSRGHSNASSKNQKLHVDDVMR